MGEMEVKPHKFFTLALAGGGWSASPCSCFGYVNYILFDDATSAVDLI
jgi:hypothetical protein